MFVMRRLHANEPPELMRGWRHSGGGWRQKFEIIYCIWQLKELMESTLSADIFCEIAGWLTPPDIAPLACACKWAAGMVRDCSARIWRHFAAQIPQISSGAESFVPFVVLMGSRNFPIDKIPEFPIAKTELEKYRYELLTMAYRANNLNEHPCAKSDIAGTKINWSKNIGEIEVDPEMIKKIWVPYIYTCIYEGEPVEWRDPLNKRIICKGLIFDIFIDDNLIATAKFHGSDTYILGSVYRFYPKISFYFSIYTLLSHKITYKCYSIANGNKISLNPSDHDLVFYFHWFEYDNNLFSGSFSSWFIRNKVVVQKTKFPYKFLVFQDTNPCYWREIIRHINRRKKGAIWHEEVALWFEKFKKGFISRQ